MRRVDGSWGQCLGVHEKRLRQSARKPRSVATTSPPHPIFRDFPPIPQSPNFTCNLELCGTGLEGSMSPCAISYAGMLLPDSVRCWQSPRYVVSSQTALHWLL